MTYLEVLDRLSQNEKLIHNNPYFKKLIGFSINQEQEIRNLKLRLEQHKEVIQDLCDSEGQPNQWKEL